MQPSAGRKWRQRRVGLTDRSLVDGEVLDLCSAGRGDAKQAVLVCGGYLGDGGYFLRPPVRVMTWVLHAPTA